MQTEMKGRQSQNRPSQCDSMYDLMLMVKTATCLEVCLLMVQTIELC